MTRRVFSRDVHTIHLRDGGRMLQIGLNAIQSDLEDWELELMNEVLASTDPVQVAQGIADELGEWVVGTTFDHGDRVSIFFTPKPEPAKQTVEITLTMDLDTTDHQKAVEFARNVERLAHRQARVLAHRAGIWGDCEAQSSSKISDTPSVHTGGEAR